MHTRSNGSPEPTVSDSEGLASPPASDDIAPVVRRGRPKGSKNKPKLTHAETQTAPTEWFGNESSADRSDSTENNPKPQHAVFLEAHKKGIKELHDFATNAHFLAQAQPLVDRINAGFDEVDETGRTMLKQVRGTGVLLHEWKAAVGHGNWVEAYESSGFHKSINTARNWMRLALMTGAEIAEVTSVREALALLKDEKERRKKGEAGDSGLGMGDDEDDDDDGDQSGDTDPIPPAPKPEPEPLDLLETAVVKVCRKYSREEVERAFTSMLNEHYPVTPL